MALVALVLPAAPSYADGKRGPHIDARSPGKPAAAAAQTKTIIVTFDSGKSNPRRAARSAVARAAAGVAGAAITKVEPITDDTVAVTLDTPLGAAQQARLTDQVEDMAGVASAEASMVFHPTATNDTYYSYLWNLKSGSANGVDAEGAWPTSDGSGAIVGVVDTGITAHPDLTGSDSSIVGGNVVAGYDFISDTSVSGDDDVRDPDPTDPGDYCTEGGTASSWHGTHVAGTIAAIRDNSRGVVGVAPGAKVQPLRVLGNCGGATEDLVAAMRWGAGLEVSGITPNATPVDVLNLSLGGLSETCPASIQDAIDDVVAAGVTVVVAAGNADEELAGWAPANCAKVIRVTASTYEGARAGYSNYGTTAFPATIAAPGGSADSGSDPTDWIASTWNDGTTTAGNPDYAWMAGTSMATPHVSAVVAMLKALDPTLTTAQLTALMTDTATPLSTSCTATKCGAGIVDAAAAVQAEAAALQPGVTISGAVRVGGQLTASVTPASAAATATYQWLRDGAEVGRATDSTYTPAAEELGTTISVRAVLTVDAIPTTVEATAGTVAPGTFSYSVRPYATGTFRVGRTVRANTGTWSPEPATYSYRWFRGSKAIKHATKATYRLRKADRHKKVRVRVTVSLDAYTTTAKKSVAKKVR
ncbi:MAG: S8 family serine peptidase [Propionibacteriaceae bacterium]|nr:S8 family serine peptidase [Propionibacteriaceae bacterium]